MLALRFISGKYQGGEFPIEPSREVLVGRSSDLDMVLVEEMVSRRHAKLICDGGALQVEDLNSTNGTFVNGEKVTKATLDEGDRLLIGSSILKVVRHDEASPRYKSREIAVVGARDRSVSEPARKDGTQMGASVRDRIFVSYRRTDTPHSTDRLVEALAERFGKSAVFHDVDSIPLGSNFRDHINRGLRACGAVIAMIGDRWLSTDDETGRPRIHQPEDVVRTELELALSLGVPVIPALILPARMPSKSELPESLQELVDYNGIEIRPNPGFRDAVARIIRDLEQLDWAGSKPRVRSGGLRTDS